MNPLRITAENYRSFERLDLELPTGCVAVVGENGAGKSSIVNAIDLALFGSRNLGDYVSEDRPDSQLELALEFEHRGEFYRVRRSRKKNATKLDFEHVDVVELGYETRWAPLTRETAAATQALIEETIGLSRETFRASAFLAQGDGAAFTEAQPRERKAILAEVLGLDVWDRLLVLAKNDRNRLEATGHRLTTELAFSREELAKRPAIEASRSELTAQAQALQDELARLEAMKTEAQAALAAAREKAAELRGAREACATHEADRARVKARLVEISARQENGAALAAQRQQLSERATRVGPLEEEFARAGVVAAARLERERLHSEAARSAKQAADLIRKADALQRAEVDACERCGQTLDAQARTRAIDSYRQEIAAVDARTQELRREADAVEHAGEETRDAAQVQQELTAARADAERVAEIDLLLAGLSALADEREQLESRLPDLERAVEESRAKIGDEQPADEAPLVRAVMLAEGQIVTARTTLDRTRQELAVAESKLRDSAEFESSAAVLEQQQRELQAELDVVLLAERAYGRDGIPTMIVENAAIPQIEVEANRILAELGTSFTVELRTQREKKTGGIAESLDIIVVGPAGARPYETFSGGERTRLNLSLRIALARLLAHRRGAEVRLLVIDEPEFLDEAGVARLADVLRGLSPDFERVFLISHQPALREAFDEVLSVVKVGERSSVEGVPTMEVAA